MKEVNLSNLVDLPFSVEESLNQLRVALGYSGENVKTIMITSSLPNEGKSFVALNLWRMMANAGNKVVLIDCDLRNSSFRSKYNLTGEGDLRGIVHYLAGKADAEDVIYHTNIPNGYIIPVISNVSSPSMLLEGRRFSMLLDACRQVFDYVIIDTPPLGAVADALNIVRQCDGSVLVVRSGEIPRKMVQDSIDMLRRTGKPFFGTVLNRVRVNHNTAGYYYRRYYYYGKYYSRYYGGYGYGYGYGKKPYGAQNDKRK